MNAWNSWRQWFVRNLTVHVLTLLANALFWPLFIMDLKANQRTLPPTMLQDAYGTKKDNLSTQTKCRLQTVRPKNRHKAKSWLRAERLLSIDWVCWRGRSRKMLVYTRWDAMMVGLGWGGGQRRVDWHVGLFQIPAMPSHFSPLYPHVPTPGHAIAFRNLSLTKQMSKTLLPPSYCIRLLNS